MYGGLAFGANGNQLDANIAAGAGTLINPLLIVSGYSGGDPTVKLGGITLVADVDYCASLRPAANELWVTLNRNLSGATNHIEIIGTPAALGAHFDVLASPCRLLDTRGGGALAPSSVRNLMFVGVCGLPSGITAAATNVAVVSPAAEGYVTLYPGPSGSARPFAATLNYTPDRTLANNANASVAADGTVNIFNSGAAPLDFVIDINGYFK